MKIIGLYSGIKSFIGPKSTPSGIVKLARNQVEVNTLGIIDDIQVDKRFHGGPERALHQFSLLSYQKIIQRFPLLHKKAWPGAIGENISAQTMNEDNVCIGDIYAAGTTVIQVSGPRIPCWKIDATLNQPGLSQFIQSQRLSGWYYRVLENGKISNGEQISLLERKTPDLSVRLFLSICFSPQMQSQYRQLILSAQGLDPEWHAKLLNKPSKSK